MNPNTAISKRCVFRLIAVLSFAVLVAVGSLAQTTPPLIVSTVGYINGTPLTVHTSSAFKSSGASTLAAFVSTNTPWNGLPVSINGISDNLGNTWSVLTGPTVFGSSWILLSAIYYVNNPVTSASQTVTVQLSNPAPLVFHVFAGFLAFVRSSRKLMTKPPSINLLSALLSRTQFDPPLWRS